MERRSRRWWTLILSLVAGLVVLASVLSLVFSLAVNAVPAYRDKLESRVAEAVGHPVKVGGMALTWHDLQPTLDLREVAVLGDDGKPLAQFSRLRLGFDLRRLAHADWAPSVAELYGLELSAEIDAMGHVTLRGFGAGGGDPDAALRGVERFSSIGIRDSRLTLHAYQLGGAPQLFTIALAELHHSGSHYSLSVNLAPPADLAGNAQFDSVLDGRLDQPDTWQGAWALAISGMSGWPGLEHALKPGVRLVLEGAGLHLSGRLEGGKVASLGVQAEAARVSAMHGEEVLARVSAVSFEASSVPEPGAWRTEIAKLALSGARGPWAPVRGSLHYQAESGAGAQGVILDAALDSLRVDDVAPWLLIWKDLGLPARLRGLRGDVRQIALHYQHPDSGADRYSLQAQLADAGLAGEAGEPGLAGLAGALSADQDGGHLVLDKDPLQIQLPDVFEQPLPPMQLSGDFGWKHGDDGWQVAAQGFDWTLLTTTGHGGFSLLLPADDTHSPVLHLAADFSAPDVLPLKPYKPKTWGPGAREWLDRALVRVGVRKAHLQLDGPLNDFPFDKNPDGVWALDLEVADATLAYSPGWMPAEHLHAQLKFRGNSLQIEADGASLGGNSIDHVSARIPELDAGQLTVDGSTSGEGARYYAFLRASPLQKKLSGLLDQTELSGPAAVDVHLEMPLNKSDPDVRTNVVAHFNGDTLRVHGLDAPVQAVNGVVTVAGSVLHADSLSGTLMGTALSATIQPAADSPDGSLLAQLDAPVQDDKGLAAAYLPDWLRSRLTGTAHWTARLPLSGAHSGQLSLSSDLRGVASSLPAPLSKAADDSLPLTVTVGEGLGSSAPQKILIDAAPRVRVALRWAAASAAEKGAAEKKADKGAEKSAASPGLRSVQVHFGDTPMPRADSDGLWVDGAPDQLDAKLWMALMGSIGGEPGGGGLAFRGADLSPHRLFYRGAALLPTHLVVTPGPDGWTALLDGAGAQGTISYLRAGGGSVQARLDHAALEPLGPMFEEGEGKPQPFDPGQTATLDLDCGSLKLGDTDLGHLVLHTVRVDGGQSLDALKLGGGLLDLDGHGQWLRAEGQSSGTVTFTLSSAQMGQVLTSLGYAESLTAKKATITTDLHWQPVADGLDPAQTEGQVDLAFEKGSLKAVKPGAGRMLGLLNLYALPRRLTFDFRDVVAKGLSFDKLSGSFKLAGGQAQTDDVQIVSPSMKMQMSGRIGLAARDYDEQVTVYPDVSTEVIVGAALVNPIAGGVALLAQELFNKPFNKLAKFSYHVSGSWENPEVKVGEVQEVPATPPPSAKAGSPSKTAPAPAPAAAAPAAADAAVDAPQN